MGETRHYSLIWVLDVIRYHWSRQGPNGRSLSRIYVQLQTRQFRDLSPPPGLQTHCCLSCREFCKLGFEDIFETSHISVFSSRWHCLLYCACTNGWSHPHLPLCFTVIHGALLSTIWAEKRNCRETICVHIQNTYPISIWPTPSWIFNAKKVLPSTTILC